MQEIAAFVGAIGSILGVFAFFQWSVAKRTLKLELMTKVHERYSKLYKRLASLENCVTPYQSIQDEDK